MQVRRGRYLDLSKLDCMQRALFHRGPDSQGRHVQGATAIASARLAIVDLLHGDQPLYDAEGRALVANAEMYNSPELRAAHADYPFRTASDCEVIFPLYEAYGLDFARHLRGMYAVALCDGDRLILTRDPFGIKPLYFVEHDAGFAFASEIGPLLEAGFAKRREDDTAKAELLQLKYVIGDKTIVPGISRLNPGETIVVEDGAIVQRLDMDAFAVAPKQTLRTRMRGALRRSPDALLGRFDAVMTDSVAVHLRADVPSCLFYSGGVDSTVLMVLAKDMAARPPESLTVGYSGSESVDESREALRLSALAGVKCHRIEMGADEFWSLAPRIVAALDDPMADPAVLPLYMLGRETHRHGYKVAICGEGADELFGGYSRYRRATIPRPAKRSRRGVFAGTDAERGIPAWAEAMDAVTRREQQRRSSQLQALQAVDLMERLPNCLLIKLDRALMINSVEGRTPFLDREVAAFAMQLPDGLRSNPFVVKRFLRDWLAARFPAARPYARKRGFGVPLGSWMAQRPQELSDLVSRSPGIRPWFEPATVRGVFEQARQNTQPAWNLLCYTLWHARYMLQLDCEGDIGAVLSAAARAG